MTTYQNIHGVDLEVDKDMVVLSHKRNGGFEDDTFEILQMIIDKLSQYHSRPLVFGDVGVYTGIYSIYAAMQGLKVEAFEPNPNVYKRLQSNIRHNHSKVGGWSGEIITHNCALSDSTREALLHHNNNVELTSGGSLELPSLPTLADIDDTRTINKYVYRVTTDTYRNLAHRCPDIVKIDVEGHEMSVLRGMGLHDDRVLYKPYLIVESNHYDNYCEIKDYLTELDYGFVGLLDARNMVFEPKDRYNLLMNSIIS